MVEPEACIKVERLSKTYRRGRVRALEGVNLDINEGEIFGLIGPNGAGKTTLMFCLLGLLRPSSGSIKVFGCSPDDLEVKRQCAFLPERPNFDSWMTARQFMRYHHMLARRPAKTARQDIEEALSAVELEPSAWNRRVKTFSRGMLQRLGLGQVLIGKPRICFLDEPGAGMDPLGTSMVRNLVLALKRKNVTVVLNSHHLAEVERVCDRVAFIRSGKIQQVEELSALNAEHITVLVKTSDDADPPSQETLAEIAAEVQGMFVGCDDHSLRFRLKTSADKAQLIRLLVARQVAVEEVVQEKRALEDLFAPIKGDEDTR